MQTQVVAKSLTYLRFNENSTNHVTIGDQDGFVYIIELPTTLTKMVGDEVSAMREFYQRE